jgi:hypothetical protein
MNAALSHGVGLAAALTLAGHGLATLPLKAGRKDPCTSHGVHDATKDPSVLGSAFGAAPCANVGIACGPISGCFVVDVDPRNKGDVSLASIVAAHGELPRTWEARTGRGDGGRHIFFRLPDGVKLRGKLGAGGIDVLSRGKYVVAAPSIHPDTGKPYAWTVAPDAAPLADAPAWLLALVTKPEPKPRAVTSSASPASAVSKRFRAWMAHVEPAIDGAGDGKTFLTSRGIWGWVLNHGLPESEGRAAFDAWNQTCAPPWEEPDVDRKWEEGRKADSHPEYPDHLAPSDEADFVPAEPAAQRPAVHVTTALHATITEAIDALATDPNIYRRESTLVDVVRADARTADAFVTAGAPRIRTVSVASVRERLTRVAKVLKFEKGARQWVPCLPSDHVVQGVLARGEYPSIRPIVGLLEAPSMRRDGTIIQTAGYDAASGYLYQPSVDFARVPDRPTQADAAQALAELEEVFCDFPFGQPFYRAAAIAAALTILVRPAIDGAVPCFLCDANTRGSGKSLVSDAVSTLVTGRAVAKMGFPWDDEELEKVLAAYAVRGASIVCFDNIIKTFGGHPLDRYLTATDTVELRILGKTEVPTVPWRGTILGSGNNIMMKGDTSRRALIIRIESPLEHPEDRADFKHHPLLPWVKAERPRLVVAALTLLRAWHVAGRRSMGLNPWGSFEAWSATIPAALVFAGSVDPMAARPATLDEGDPEKIALLCILENLSRLDVVGRGLTVKEIIAALYPQLRHGEPRTPDGFDDLREAIESLAPPIPGRAPDPNAFGYVLRRFKRRVVGGRRLDIAPGRAGVARWRVVGQGHPGYLGGGDDGDGGDVSRHSLKTSDPNTAPAPWWVPPPSYGEPGETSPPSQPSPPSPDEGSAPWDV